MRMEKVKSRAGLVGRLKHNTREHITANIDTDRSSLNLTKGGSVSEVMARYSEMLPDKVRKNAVCAVEIMMTASPDFSGSWEEYLKKCDEWASGLFGKENVLSVAHHLDETTPHTQVIVMPLKDGKLNAKHFIGGSRDRMTELQNDFHEMVGKPAGLERGQPRTETRARHSHHTLARKSAELDERENALSGKAARLDEREAKLKETAEDLKKIIGRSPADMIALKKEMDKWGKQTGQDLSNLATMMKVNKCETVGAYFLTVEEKKKQREQQQGRSFHR
jgi:hypothetical protein